MELHKCVMRTEEGMKDIQEDLERAKEVRDPETKKNLLEEIQGKLVKLALAMPFVTNLVN